MPFCNRDVDRFLVDIEPYEHATVAHDLPPCVARCDAVRRDTSSTKCEDGRSMLLWRDLISIARIRTRRMSAQKL